jgi:KUP system potassium uptake protein
MREILKLAGPQGIAVDYLEASYFLGREHLIPTERPGMALWRERLFAVMSRNALGPTAYFDLPPNRVVELGAQIEI